MQGVHAKTAGIQRQCRMRQRRRACPAMAGGSWPAALAGLVLALASPAFGRRDFSRYEVILQRRPFGFIQPEAVPPPPVAPPPMQPSFVDKLQMVALRERGGRIRVGFVDNNVNPPRSYYLFVGDADGGFEIIEADFKAETARIRKDGKEALLAMRRAGGGMGAGTEPETHSRSADRAAAPGSRSPRQPIPRSTLTREQYAREREAGVRGAPRPPHHALRQDPDAAPSLAELPSELREHALRRYNLELIRARGESGLPLPIPLTPEEDEQLVKEGVLDP